MGERLISYLLIGEEIEKISDICFTVILKDIEVGKAVRPQLASRVSNAKAAWKKVLRTRNYCYSICLLSSFVA